MLVKGVQKTPKTLLAIAVALGYLPEVKAPNTKTLYGSDPRTRESELDLTESLLPEDSSHSIKGAMQVSIWKKQPIRLHSCDDYEPQQRPRRQDFPKSSIVVL